MKIVSKIMVMTCCMISVSVYALGGTPPSTKTDNKAEASATSVAVSANSNSNKNTVSSQQSLNNNVNLENYYSNEYNNHHSMNSYERIQHVAPSSSQNCIQGVCKATSAVVVTGGYDEVTGNSINLGVVIPFGGGSSSTESAMKVALGQMEDNRLHERERHQSEMAMMCMQIHQILARTGEEASPELWSRCSGFEHHEGALKGHRGHSNPAQYSPHAH